MYFIGMVVGLLMMANLILLIPGWICCFYVIHRSVQRGANWEKSPPFERAWLCGVGFLLTAFVAQFASINYFQDILEHAAQIIDGFAMTFWIIAAVQARRDSAIDYSR